MHQSSRKLNINCDINTEAENDDLESTFNGLEAGYKKLLNTDGAAFNWRLRTLSRLKRLPVSRDSEKVAFCKTRIAKFGIVHVVLDSPYVGVVEKDVRVTWTEKFGMLGGTIGLFTGMSFISFMECFYWAGIFCISSLKWCKRRFTLGLY